MALYALTRQEFHVARVLAGDTTTREAAAALFLGTKKIEYHLRNVYRKLGVNSRTERRRRTRVTAGSRQGQG